MQDLCINRNEINGYENDVQIAPSLVKHSSHLLTNVI